MKLHLNITDGLNNISAHGAGFVIINQQRYETPVVVMPDRLISPWEIGDTPSSADFEAVLQLKPELVVFGSGAAFRFPDPRIMAMFAKAKIGFDVMDTPAACRTYNVLMSEGRNVAAALLVE
ncbi:MAG: Mth938-like domain-containing protein [Betaproteobacteria bacterium]